jgi:spore germination protein YaaH/putative cell wall-binding protein
MLLQDSTLSTAQSSSSSNKLFNMSYLFLGAPNTYVSQIDRTKGSLDVVSPNYFDITAAGQLDVTWRLQSSFISEMHKRGIKVTPFLSNHWDKTAGINGLNNRDKLARDIASAIEKYNLDGVNVDIEGVGHAYRDAHTDFIRLLRLYIPSHKEVSIAVAANPNGWTTGWHGFYDYKGMARYADYLMIMAYDESWESPDSPVGPVSSIQFFEKSIKYAVDQSIPRDKIVIGLPFYGRMWKTDGPTLENRYITGMGISSTRVGPLVAQFKGAINFDEKTKSPYASFTIPKGGHYFIGSTKLTEGNYLIWYENEYSITAKLALPYQYGIKGTGSWALGHETPETWNYYTAALNKGVTVATQTVFSSGPLALLTGSNINFREAASTSGRIIRTLSGNEFIKITGAPVTSENYVWYPGKLADGTSGYVAADYLKLFDLTELHGPTRYDTGVVISASGWKEGSGVIILGRGDIPIDALTGSVLAKKYGAPLLLTNSNSLPDKVSSEIERLHPKTIYILGGEGAVSKAIQNQLVQRGHTVKRITGETRYETAVGVANEVGAADELILATGNESPDALSIGPYAGFKQIPIVLTRVDELPTQVKDLIKKSRNIKKVTIIGGTGVVSERVEEVLKNLGVQTIERISGINRYETSIAIAKRYKNELSFNNLYFASGESFIDALPGSPLAAVSGAPIILVHPTTMLSPVRDFLQNELAATPDITILGGYGILPYGTRATILQTLR